MSFILDALKKAERKRQRTGVPRLDTQHSLSSRGTSRLPWMLVALLSVLFLGLTARHFLTSADGDKEGDSSSVVAIDPANAPPSNEGETLESEPQAPAPEVGDEQRPQSGAIADEPPPELEDIEEPPPPDEDPEALAIDELEAEAEMADPMEEPFSEEPENLDPADVEPPEVTAPVNQEALARKTPPKLTASKPPQPTPSLGTTLRMTDNLAKAENPPTPRASAPPLATEPRGSGQEIPLFEQTSPDIQGALPKVKISILAYTKDPAQRTVYINGQKYLESDVVESKFKIEDITRSGVIMSYQGQRFLLKP
jgi:general secretion pathway protein B